MGERVLDRGARDLAEGDPPDPVLGDAGVVGNVPGDRLALPIQVGREPDRLGAARPLRQLVELALALLERLIARRKVVLDVHPEAALREVADMAVRGQDGIALAKVSLDGLRLGG